MGSGKKSSTPTLSVLRGGNSLGKTAELWRVLQISGLCEMWGGNEERTVKTMMEELDERVTAAETKADFGFWLGIVATAFWMLYCFGFR